MSKRSRKAGQNIRALALKRRFKAIVSFCGAGVVIFFSLYLIKTFETMMTQPAASNSSQAQSSLNIPPMLYVMIFVMAFVLMTNGVFLWKRANNADRGAEGEEVTSQEISLLEQEGWKIEYGMRLGNKLGDADIVCISPNNKSYVIDVKSHKGEVITDGIQLQRRMGKTIYSFEKDFIAQAMKQALQVRKQKGLKFVTPILTFSDAKVLVPSNKLRKVYVVEKSHLTSLLKSLG